MKSTHFALWSQTANKGNRITNATKLIFGAYPVGAINQFTTTLLDQNAKINFRKWFTREWNEQYYWELIASRQVRTTRLAEFTMYSGTQKIYTHGLVYTLQLLIFRVIAGVRNNEHSDPGTADNMIIRNHFYLVFVCILFQLLLYAHSLF